MQPVMCTTSVCNPRQHGSSVYSTYIRIELQVTLTCDFDAFARRKLTHYHQAFFDSFTGFLMTLCTQRAGDNDTDNNSIVNTWLRVWSTFSSCFNSCIWKDSAPLLIARRTLSHTCQASEHKKHVINTN